MSNGQPVRVKSPLGEDLVFASMELSEEMGRLFHCKLEMLSPDGAIPLDDILGQDMTVEIDLPTGATRYVHGYVSQMAQTGRRAGNATYSATVRPWLWFLTRRSDCRIFQEMKVPDIIKEIFRDHGFSDFKESLTGDYRTWEYCVQYRETDFNFVSRLMEQEGIYYFFEYEDGKNVLVLADAYGAHSLVTDYEKFAYNPGGGGTLLEETIYDWQLSKCVTSGGYGVGAFHFKNPKANLEAYAQNPHPHAMAEYEIFDYPGEYFETSEGDRYAAVRIEELQAQYERARGQTNAMALFPGALFELTEFPRDDQNREHLIVSAHHSLSLGEHEVSATGGALEYSCGFEAIDSQLAFRTERSTPKPTVQGPQTAIVVGPPGEEIHTDEFGRVRVQFKWDRKGESNETSSCWVRVGQSAAGSNWGGIVIPRMGQEVIVDFIEGDPDRPIITGRVYNADNMPPYELPANRTQSGIKSRSTKGGTAENFNEIRFEDLKGEEEMYLHAEKNQTIMVEADKGETIGANNTESVGNDENIDVGNDRNKTIGNNQTESIGVSKTIQVGKNHTESVGSNMTVNVGSNLTETVAINYAETVGAAMELTIGAAMTETVGGNKSQTIGRDKTETIASSLSVSVGNNRGEVVGGSSTAQIGEDQLVEIGKKLSINAGDQITIATGKAKITMKKDGTISIEGKNITLKGSGAINVKASKNIVLKGKKILEN